MKPAQLAGKAEAAGERVEGAQREAVVEVTRLGQAFTTQGVKPAQLAGKAEAAGERVEGAQREAVVEVTRLGQAFTTQGVKPAQLAGKAEAAGERVEGAQREAVVEVTRLGQAFTTQGVKPAQLAGKAEAAGERVEGAQREAVVEVTRLGQAFTTQGTKPGQFAAKAEAAGERVEGAQREAIAEVNRLGDAFGRAGKRATGMGGKVAGVGRRVVGSAGSLGAAFGLAGGAFAGAAIAKQVASVETRTERLGVVSERSTEEMNALRDEIYDIANAPDIRIDPSQLLTGVEAIFEKTGDLEFARDNLRLIAEAIQGSGGTGDAIGRLVAEFKKLGITASGDVAKAFNNLFVVGNMGSFTLENMSAEGAKLVSSFVRLGYSGLGAVKQIGALSQVAMSVSGTAPEAVSAVEGFLSAFTDAAKLEKIETELGVQVRLDDGSYRDISKIATELVAAVGGDIVELSEVFDATGLRVIGGLTSKTGQELYRQSLDVAPTGNEVTEASARIAQTTEAQAQDLRTSAEALFVKFLTGPLGGVATALTTFKGELVAVAATAVTLGTAFKATKGAMGAISAARASRGGGAAEAVGDTEFGGDPREQAAGPGRGKGKPGLGARVSRMQVGTLYAKRMVGAAGKARGGGVMGAMGGDSDSGSKGKVPGRVSRMRSRAGAAVRRVLARPVAR